MTELLKRTQRHSIENWGKNIDIKTPPKIDEVEDF